jgi:hypothetical protein
MNGICRAASASTGRPYPLLSVIPPTARSRAAAATHSGVNAPPNQTSPHTSPNSACRYNGSFVAFNT